MATPLSLAVCLAQNVTMLDYQGPMEYLGALSPTLIEMGVVSVPRTPYTITTTYLSDTMEPVLPVAGARMLPDKTYDQAKTSLHYDILLIPGGLDTFPGKTPPSLIEFLKEQAPKARYILSVCTGSWVLAQAGMLDGRRATTNKSLFNVIKADTSHQPITWIPKARWVVDGNYWTSSGVTAGIDMAYAFVKHLTGEETAEAIRAMVEHSIREHDDDEFAAHYGLVEA